MKFIQELYKRNIILARLGTIHLSVALLLIIYFFFNHTVVLGLNSIVKPIKFALSIAIYSYTMAWLLYYLHDKRKVIVYSYVAVIAMIFEQSAITLQALRGQKSHFNISSAFGATLYTLMGIFILTLTLWTAYIAFLFIKQKVFSINRTCVSGIRIGVIYFVVFSLFGGYIASRTGHSVGGEDGGSGLPFINWSTLFGDLRIAHFFGIHSLQLIPLFAWVSSKYIKEESANKLVWIFSIIYFAFIMFTLIQALMGKPFISIQFKKLYSAIN